MQQQLSSLHVAMEQNSSESERKLQQVTSDKEYLIHDKNRYIHSFIVFLELEITKLRVIPDSL